MLEEINDEKQNLRWTNAVRIINQLKLFCSSNDKGFILDDGIIYTSDDINIDYSTGLISLNNKNAYINLYINDVYKDEGVHDTTEKWLKRTGLMDVKFVNLNSTQSFYKDVVQGDVLNF